jgi:hypothetical protein
MPTDGSACGTLAYSLGGGDEIKRPNSIDHSSSVLYAAAKPARHAGQTPRGVLSRASNRRAFSYNLNVAAAFNGGIQPEAQNLRTLPYMNPKSGWHFRTNRFGIVMVACGCFLIAVLLFIVQ